MKPPEAADLGIDTAFGDRLSSTMSTVDGADFELVDPPDGMWDRIAASIAAQPAGTPAGSGTVVGYSIDADDVVIAVDGDWAEFARQNGAPELVELAPPRTLWSYFDSDEVRDLWRLLIERVRAKQAQAHVPVRCDAPDVRRWFEITITPEPSGVVHFRSVLVFEQPRTSVSLLDPRAERDNDASAVPVCSWCGKGYDGTQWLEVEDLLRTLRLLESLVPSISHGICPTCRELMSAELLVPEQTRDSRS